MNMHQNRIHCKRLINKFPIPITNHNGNHGTTVYRGIFQIRHRRQFEMTVELINGRELSKDLRQGITEDVQKLKEKGVNPHLTVVLVGDDPGSQSYVKGKEKACAETGMSSDVIRLEDTVTQDELVKIVENLNTNDDVHGILVQLPLPEHIDEKEIVDLIDPDKDVDGFHPTNVGRMMTGQETLLPCTPNGVMELLKSKDIEVEGKHAVVVGASNIVGKPVGQLLLNREATVTYCHIKTKDLKAHTKMADILVVAIGNANFITEEHIKEGVVIIDVGINRLDDGSLTGDVDFESVRSKASYITPVPGGVGPMTITMLLMNTITACEIQHDLEV